MKADRGLFITLEGGEGTGKSTQARLLAAHLRALGLDVLETREPGGSAGAEAIRHVLLSGAAQPFGEQTEAMLFAAARADHVDETIRPALHNGQVVVCDRFIDSSRVYQGALGKVDGGFLDALETVVVDRCRPDLTLVLDVPAELGLARASARGSADRFEKEGAGFHAAVREAFLALAARDDRHVVIDARGSVSEVAEYIIQAVEDRLAPSGAPQPAGIRAQ